LVVKFAGAVDGESNQKAMPLEKRHPGFIEEQAVRLEVILNPLARLSIALLERNNPLEEVQTHDGGLASLPREDDFLAGIGLDVLPNVQIQ
jgi:hypothetical protein